MFLELIPHLFIYRCLGLLGRGGAWYLAPWRQVKSALRSMICDEMMLVVWQLVNEFVAQVVEGE